MREDDYLAIADALKDIAEGSFAMKEGSSLKKFQEPLEGELQTRTTGKGKILCFGVYPGIEVSFHQYLADKVQFHHKAIHSILEVSHCRKGRIGWNMRNHISVYLGAGDLCLRTMDCCADSEMSLPLGYYEGLSFSLDLKVLQNHCPQIVREANIDIQRLHQKFCEKGTPVAIPSSNIIEGIFDVLYELSPTLLLPYYKLKAQELLLYLSQWEPSEGKEVIPYCLLYTSYILDKAEVIVSRTEKKTVIYNDVLQLSLKKHSRKTADPKPSAFAILQDVLYDSTIPALPSVVEKHAVSVIQTHNNFHRNFSHLTIDSTVLYHISRAKRSSPTI